MFTYPLSGNPTILTALANFVDGTSNHAVTGEMSVPRMNEAPIGREPITLNGTPITAYWLANDGWTGVPTQDFRASLCRVFEYDGRLPTTYLWRANSDGSSKASTSGNLTVPGGSAVLYDGTHPYFVMGFPDPPLEIDFTLTIPKTSGTLLWERKTGASTWTTIAVTDGTNAFTQSGTADLSALSGWSRQTETLGSLPGVDYYWVRVSSATGSGNPEASKLEHSNQWTSVPLQITLPLAATRGAGSPITLIDASGSDSPRFDVITQGSDTITAEGLTSYSQTMKNGAVNLLSDGVSVWYIH